METHKNGINIINKFLSETQPNKKIEIANTIKNNGIYGINTYNKIMKQEPIYLSDKIYFYNKNTNKYSFVNITKGHICSCVFNSIDEAIEDMEERKKKGLIDRYRRIKYD